MNFKKILLGFLLSFLCFSAESMVVYGHRGARGLAPENTIPAFQAAVKAGVDAIDLDVVMTKDGVLAVYHDLTLSPEITRTADGHWLDKNTLLIIKNLTFEQLQAYDVGRIAPGTIYAETYAAQTPKDHTHIPSLQTVIQAMKETADYPVGFQIEIKTDPTRPDLSVSTEEMVIALDELLKAEGVSERTKVQAYDWKGLLLLQRLNPAVETGFLTDLDHEKVLRSDDPNIAGAWTAGYLLKDYHDSIPEMIHALGGSWWDVEDISLSLSRLKKAHQLGLKVSVWTYPERTGKEIDIPLLEKLIAMPVDGVITDRPDLVMKLLHR